MTQSTGSLNRKPGDYKLDEFVMTSMVNGSVIDLRSVFKKIEIFEDIFSPYISAVITLEDAKNLPERFPIIGNEKIRISFKTDNDTFVPINLVLRVYKMDSQKIGDTGKTQTYKLHLMSEGGYFNYTERCGYSVRGPVSEMVHTIFKKHFPSFLVSENRIEVEPTTDNYSFVLPKSYSPYKAISWLTTKAHSGFGMNYSPYLFYETVDGHKFKSISGIVRGWGGAKNLVSPPVYVLSTGNVPGALGGLAAVAQNTSDQRFVGSALPSDWHKIQELEELNRFDVGSKIMNGIISSRVVVHDLVNKQTRTKKFDELDTFPFAPKLGKFPHTRLEDTESHRLWKDGALYTYLPSTSNTVHSKLNNIRDNFKTEDLYLKRKYLLGTFLTQKLAMTIFGDSRRRVGDVVEVSVPKIQSDSVFQTEKDKNLSGEYLVTAIRHTLTHSYHCKMELSRNCMGVY